MLPLPILSAREVIKALEKAGWKFARQKGSHVMLIKIGERRPLVIPNHKEIAKGTLRSIIREAGLTVQEFIELLK
ncbi:MAG: hypothetical protein PWR10_1829 [Halanaerobiales bacterium]|nr:hypothetical protein [Halanaerobiales bacterium]